MKILIVNNNMHIGGVQRALVNLLKCIHDKYDITLLLFHPEGELMSDIPKDVKVLPARSAYRFLGMTREDVKDRFISKTGRSFFAAVCRLLGRSTSISIMALSQKTLKGYDTVISYLHDAGDYMFYGGCNDFVLRHTQAHRKYAFLHCDFLLSGANTPSNVKRYTQFDRIVACSEGCREAFGKAAPHLKQKTDVVCNCQDYDRISSAAAEAAAQLPQECLNIVTVARLGKEKGVIRAIKAMARLKDVQAPFHYFIIGDGIERTQIQSLIEQNGLQERVTLLGEMQNPYGYMKAADLLLMPSVSEAAPMVIGEAASLGTPILTTETTSAREMVEKTGFGWVCENSVDGIEKALRQLIGDASVITAKASSLKACTFDNQNAVEQFARLMSEL